MSQHTGSNSSGVLAAATVALPLSTTNLTFMSFDTNNGTAICSPSFPPFPHTMNTNVASSTQHANPAGSITQSRTTSASIDREYVYALGPMSSTSSPLSTRHDCKTKIIQCPNPTHNPILHHQKQQESVMSEKRQQCDVQYMETLELKLAEQAQFIQQLINQNRSLSSELAQSQSQMSTLHAQNSAMFAAYNALQSQVSTSCHSPTSVSSWSTTSSLTGTGGVGAAVGAAVGVGVGSELNSLKDVYEHWNVQQVMNWVACLDGNTFAKYRHVFELNNIDGKVLNIVTREYLDRIGVKNVQHQTALLQHIEQLKQFSNSSAANGYSTVY